DPVPLLPFRLVFDRLWIPALAADAPAIEPAGVRRAALRRLAALGARRLIGHTRLARLPPSAPVQLGVERLLVAVELAREVGERLAPRVPDGIVRYVACVHGQIGVMAGRCAQCRPRTRRTPAGPDGRTGPRAGAAAPPSSGSRPRSARARRTPERRSWPTSPLGSRTARRART